MTRPRPDRYERRLRNVQTWALLGLLAAAMLGAVLLAYLGLPSPIAVAAAVLAYLFGWQRILREVRSRRAARAAAQGAADRDPA